MSEEIIKIVTTKELESYDKKLKEDLLTSNGGSGKSSLHDIIITDDLYTYTSIGKVTGVDIQGGTLLVDVCKKGEIYGSNGEVYTENGYKLLNTTSGDYSDFTAGSATLKDVFNIILGTKQDFVASPEDKRSVSLVANKNIFGSGSEIGTTIEDMSSTITITCDNSYTGLTYGYKSESKEINTSQTCYCPLQNLYPDNSKTANCKITFPTSLTFYSSSNDKTILITSYNYTVEKDENGKNKERVVTITIANSIYVDLTADGKTIYCNFNSDKNVVFTLSFEDTKNDVEKINETDNKILYPTGIKAEVIFSDRLQDDESLSKAGSKVEKFLTFLESRKEAALVTTRPGLPTDTPKKESSNSPDFLISEGTYVPYYLFDTSDTFNKIAVSNIAKATEKWSTASHLCLETGASSSRSRDLCLVFCSYKNI